MKNMIKTVCYGIAFLTVLNIISSCYQTTDQKAHSKAETQKDRSWSVYKANQESSNYSPLDEIDVSNVNKLRHAWTYNLTDKPKGANPGKSECNPIVVDGVLYATSANQSAYALDAATGKEIWLFDPFNGKESGEVNRGLTYWEDGNDKRILFSANNFLYALNAATGKPIDSFGKSGKVDLKTGLRDFGKKTFMFHRHRRE